ncbi:hypothetical protein AAG570_010558 [Ranatra chinensis]|uniref:Protein N-terminal glutamine amidohydrolase n=1 Tax=Ranatra chinensis TaxID=642074 RepID=A0ABD0YNC9_9HEMI
MLFFFVNVFCSEENVWKLCEKLKKNNNIRIEEFYAVFVSNDQRLVPLFYQKSAIDEGFSDGKVIWDYHVILVQKGASEVNVFDMDCTLPFPSKFQLYCYFCLGSDQLLDPQFHRMFRVIPAEVYLTSFASDRRHMKKINGSWLKDPPPYEPIRCDSGLYDILFFFINVR